MKKYGILFCGYNSEKYVKDSLAPFINNEKFVISAVSVPFSEYRAQEVFEDNTTDVLRQYAESGDIHNLVDFPKYIKEHEARNLALKYLHRQEVDFVFLVDSDEIYTEEQLNNICDFVENDNENIWWRICLKNFVFDKNTYLEEPFSPPRIFKSEFDNLKLDKMYWDNDFGYVHSESGVLLTQEQLDNTTIPKDLAWVDHFTWMNDETSKMKTEYQAAHFGGICSYRWDYENNCLTFNDEYFKLRGEEKPKLIKK